MDRYTSRIKEILSTSDLASTTIKQIRIQLEQEFKVDFSQSKETINALILQTLASSTSSSSTAPPKTVEIAKTEDTLPPIAKIQPSGIAVKRDRVAQNDSMLALQIQNDEKYYETRHGRTQPPKRKPVDDGNQEEKKGSNFRVTLRASEALQVITGSARVTRQDVVKKIWEHVKTNQLADPKDGRIIVCDAALEGIFGMKRVGMFKMNALLSKHLYKAGEKNDCESESEGSGQE